MGTSLETVEMGTITSISPSVPVDWCWIIPIVGVVASLSVVMLFCFFIHFACRSSMNSEPEKKKKRRVTPQQTLPTLTFTDDGPDPNVTRWESYSRIWQTPEVSTKSQMEASEQEWKKERRRLERKLFEELVKDMSQMEGAFGSESEGGGAWTAWKQREIELSLSKSVRQSDTLPPVPPESLLDGTQSSHLLQEERISM